MIDHRARWMTVVLLLAVVQLAEAQRAISTIGPPVSSATRVARVFRATAEKLRWSFEERIFEPSQGCPGLRERFERESAVVLLTTTTCLPEIAGLSYEYVSANVGSPALCFNGTGLSAGEVFVNNATFAILKADRSRYEFLLVQALRSLGIVNPKVDASSHDYPQLVEKMQSAAFKAACVFDDGSGTAPSLMQNNHGTPVIPPQLSQANRVVGSAVVVPQRFVASQWNVAAQGNAGVLTFPIAPSPAASGPPPARLAIANAFSPVVLAGAEPTHNQRPLPGVTPVLVAKGNVDAILGPTKMAILEASIDASIDPCSYTQEEIYRSLLIAAFNDTLKDSVQAGIWELATLLRSRKDANPYYEQQQKKADAVLERVSKEQGSWLDHVTKGLNDYESKDCKAPKRYWFWEPGRSGYYQFGMRRLRDALAASPVRTDSRAFKEAASCLKAAFEHADGLGKTPTCRDRAPGMWTTYYAPYIAWAVVEAERRNAGR